MSVKTDVIYHGDCVKVLGTLPAGCAQLVVTDPPFNIGLKYDLYDDKKDYKAYLAWCKVWLTECQRILAPNGSIMVCIGDEYQAEINVLLKELGFFWRNTIIWYYTFGENQKKKFNRTHTVIHYFSKSSTDYKFYPDAVKVPSKRQLMGDKRAKAGGKIPDDVWESTGHENAAPSALPDDVWKISRICGTFKERILDDDGSAHPCQMPLSVMERLIKCSTESGDLVVDPFCGTGTTAAAAQSLGRKYITIDMSETYVRVAAARIKGDPSLFVPIVTP